MVILFFIIITLFGIHYHFRPTIHFTKTKEVAVKYRINRWGVKGEYMFTIFKTKLKWRK